VGKKPDSGTKVRQDVDNISTLKKKFRLSDVYFKALQTETSHDCHAIVNSFTTLKNAKKFTL
jgi:hypothetical protein